ncbi:MAG: hypothetical protein LBT01_00140 [Spirochaetaceae bacterium]|jgi:hypothetical protein|nr:hypothetical protein [Spirochaetaceae bacterium]
MNKRKIVTMGLLSAVLVCGLALAGCSKDAAANPFVGAWGLTTDQITIRADFQDTTWMITFDSSTQAGTYTRSGNTATLSTTGQSSTISATVSGNTLTMTFPEQPPIPLTKL